MHKLLEKTASICYCCSKYKNISLCIKTMVSLFQTSGYLKKNHLIFSISVRVAFDSNYGKKKTAAFGRQYAILNEE